MPNNPINNYKVRLIAVSSLISGINSGNASQVTFDVTPSFSESGSVDYEQITPVHMPGGIQVYKKTNSRTFEIGAHFISRTVQEATQNMIYVQTLRSWRYPYFGASSTITDGQRSQRTTSSELAKNGAFGNSGDQPLTPEERAVIAQYRGSTEGIDLLGAPPDVLYLYAYSTSANDSRAINYGVNINRVPVVMTNLSITYPEDVDYLPTFTNGTARDALGGGVDEKSEPVPIKWDVSITLVETHSPREYEQFDLAKYKMGQLPNF